jgi:hypothetical protein
LLKTNNEQNKHTKHKTKQKQNHTTTNKNKYKSQGSPKDSHTHAYKILDTCLADPKGVIRPNFSSLIFVLSAQAFRYEDCFPLQIYFENKKNEI